MATSKKNIIIWDANHTKQIQLSVSNLYELRRETANACGLHNNYFKLATAKDLTVIADEEYFHFLPNGTKLVYSVSQSDIGGDIMQADTEVSVSSSRDKAGSTETDGPPKRARLNEVSVSSSRDTAGSTETDGPPKRARLNERRDMEDEERGVQRVLEKLGGKLSAFCVFPPDDIQLLADADCHVLQASLAMPIEDVEHFQDMCFQLLQERPRQRDQVAFAEVFAKAMRWKGTDLDMSDSKDPSCTKQGTDLDMSDSKDPVYPQELDIDFKASSSQQPMQQERAIEFVLEEVTRKIRDNLSLVYSLHSQELKLLAGADTNELTESLSLSKDIVHHLKDTSQEMLTLRENQRNSCSKLRRGPLP